MTEDLQLVENEDYMLLNPERNTSIVLPWNLRVISNMSIPIRIDLRHSNLMTKLIVISPIQEPPTLQKSENEEDEKNKTKTKKIINKRIGKTI